MFNFQVRHHVGTLIGRKTLGVNYDEWNVEFQYDLIKRPGNFPLFIENATVSHRHSSMQHPFHLHVMIERENDRQARLNEGREVILWYRQTHYLLIYVCGESIPIGNDFAAALEYRINFIGSIIDAIPIKSIVFSGRGILVHPLAHPKVLLEGALRMLLLPCVLPEQHRGLFFHNHRRLQELQTSFSPLFVISSISISSPTCDYTAYHFAFVFSHNKRRKWSIVSEHAMVGIRFAKTDDFPRYLFSVADNFNSGANTTLSKFVGNSTSMALYKF